MRGFGSVDTAKAINTDKRRVGFQVLEIAVESSGLPVEFDTVDRVLVAFALPLHRDLRPPRHAGTIR